MARTVARRTLVLAALLGMAGYARAAAPDEARIRAHVARLASPAFEGRRGAGGVRAADYVVAELRKLGLKPLFGETYDQVIPGKPGEPAIGRNVGAILRGSDPKLRDEWVVVSAHFDHLGKRGERLYPGADDNASGVAMMLETARSFVESATPPRRSVMFIGFDLEEVGLFGSRYFVEHSPVPLDRIALFITADMIGRSLGGVCGNYVFVMGTENAPGLRPWVADGSVGKPITVGILGSDLLLLDRSDYGPFRSRKVPYLFFSTGESPVYHTTRDVPETLDYPKAEAISRLIYEVAAKAADSEKSFPWSSPPDHSLVEAITLRDVLKILLEHRDDLKVGPTQATIMSNTLKNLDAIVARGAITADERTSVTRVVRLIMFSIF